MRPTTMARFLPANERRSSRTSTCPTCRLAEDAAPLNEPGQSDQDDCADEGDADVADEAARLETENRAHDEAADDRAHQSEQDVKDDAVTSVHDKIGKEAGDETDDDPGKDKAKHAERSFSLKFDRLPL